MSFVNGPLTERIASGFVGFDKPVEQTDKLRSKVDDLFRNHLPPLGQHYNFMYYPSKKNLDTQIYLAVRCIF